MSEETTILIVASSGRMLAQMARISGYSPLVIDLFVDIDTRQFATEVKQVSSLSPEEIIPAANYFLEKYQVSIFVYGSGLEFYLSSLELLADKMWLLGNNAEVFQGIQDKHAFFKQLASLDIKYPKVSFSKPENPGNWLVKPKISVGGLNIRQYIKNRDYGDEFYWQQSIAGKSMSALFLADGHNAKLVGVNRQWVVKGEDQQAFIFGGVMTEPEISENNQAIITEWIKSLTRVYGLQGVNSLDFIFTPEQSYVLEINPRPSASMILYGAKLFEYHVKSCRGEIQSFKVENKRHRAYQIIYSQQELTTPAQINWPEWSLEQPAAGTKIQSGQPICSIIADGSNPEVVLQKLQKRKAHIITILKG